MLSKLAPCIHYLRLVTIIIIGSVVLGVDRAEPQTFRPAHTGNVTHQHNEKKYCKAEYVQRRVCFVNVQVVCLWPHVQCQVCYIYHVEFHFRFRRLLSFSVKHQLWSGCHSEKSSKKISGNFLKISGNF